MNRRLFHNLNRTAATNTPYTLKNVSGTNTASFPVGVYDVNGDYIGRADSKADYVSLWNSSSVNQAKGILYTDIGSFDVILALTDGQTAPTQITADERTTIGTFINEPFAGASLAAFTDTSPNATFTETGGVLQVVKAAGTKYADYLQHSYGNSMLENFVITATVTVKENDADSYGVGIGITGGNSGAALISIIGYLSCDTTDEGKLFIDHNQGGTWSNVASETATSMAVDVDDVINLTFTRNKNTYTIQAQNVTKSVTKTVSYTYSTTVSVVMPNYYKYSLYALGGNHNVESFAVTSSITKYPKVAFIGDSITQAYSAANIDGRFASLLNARLNNGWDSIVWAGNYNEAGNLVSMINELNTIAPDTVILLIGTNDTNYGAASAKGAIANLRNILAYNGYHRLYQLTLPPKTGSDDEDVNAWLLANFTNIIDIGAVALGDVVHPSGAGHTSINNTTAAAMPVYFT